MRNGIAPDVGLAVAVSIGSSKAGAALLASALNGGRIGERDALWGTMMLPFPAYLRRWPATFGMAAGMAGTAGAVFALFLLMRSAARFIVAFMFLRRGHTASPELPGDAQSAPAHSHRCGGIWRKAAGTLPLAWLLFAVTYALVPWADGLFKRYFLGGTFLPLAGWAVAASSMAHVSAALSVAGGGMASGELSTAQAVFALILGSALGLTTRVLRQNAGYYFGLFSPRLARKMLFCNLATILPFVLLSLILAAIPMLAAA
jgi:hypothetical protein